MAGGLHRRLGTGILLLILAGPSALFPRGTTAGTPVSNRVEISYQLGGISQTVSSNEDRFVVDRIVDIRIDSLDNAPVEVGPGESDRVLRFLASNLGNAEENLTLQSRHQAAGSFTPPPQNVRIYLDNGDGVFDAGQDTQTGALTLAADANATLFLVADMPDPIDGNRSTDGIRAFSDANATAGPDVPDRVDVVIRRGDSVDYGEYRVRDYALKAVKSVVVHSSDGAVHTGTRLTYQIDVTIEGGAGTIEDVVLTDPIPAGTAYVPGSIRLDGTTLSDAADADAGEYDSSPAQVVVALGTLTQHTPGEVHRIITFDVEVQ